MSSGIHPKVGARDDVRAEMETMHWCPFPGCVGGQVERRHEDSRGRFSIVWSQCGFCEGTSCVPKWKAAEFYRARVGT